MCLLGLENIRNRLRIRGLTIEYDTRTIGNFLEKVFQKNPKGHVLGRRQEFPGTWQLVRVAAAQGSGCGCDGEVILE